jgi:C4-dicarboxylate transporter/malic acid transport protein
MTTRTLHHPHTPLGADRPPHPLHRVGLFRDLGHPREVLAYLGPNWYASIMGTGIVANAAVTLPRQVPGLHTAALIVWLAASIMLVALSLAWAGHWLRHRATARGHAANPVMAQFYGAPPMALMTVGAGTLLLGKDLLRTTLAVRVDAVLWTAGTVAGLVSALVIPYLMFTRHELRPDSIFGGWLMPVVPPMVSAATGALLVPHVPAGQFRLTLLLACYAMFGLSLLASVIVTTLIWYRLTMHKLGPAATVPTLWIVLGWLGQSITAVNLLGSVAHLALPAPYSTAFTALGLVYGIPVFGFALLWIGLAASVTVRTAREHLPFTLTWWSFTFPVGTVVTGTSALAAHTGSTVITWMAVAFYLGLVGAWATVAVRTARGSLRGALFLPTAPARAAN